MTDEFKIVKTTALVGLTEVRIYPETITHIKTEHPEIPIEFPSLSAAIERTISNPTHVEGSYGQSVIFVDAETTNAGGDPFRVPVKKIEGTSGRMRTAYFAAPSGPANVIWRRKTDG